MTKQFNPVAVRAEFPILKTLTRGKPLVYLDNAATTQKPSSVIQRIEKYYTLENANIHRGVYELSEKATIAFENSRKKIQSFINAKSENEIVFTRGTTEAINLVAQSLTSQIKRGHEILITYLEHHSNIVPWQLLAQRTGATIRAVPILPDGSLNLESLDTLLNEKTKVFAFTHMSNALGTINPVKTLVAKAKEFRVLTLIDGAQAVAHEKVDVQDLGCDFYAFSGHKLYGPTGMGVLYGRSQVLSTLPPYHGGGDMIQTVKIESSTYKDIPHLFEAGTPNICGAIALGESVDFLTQWEWSDIQKHESTVMKYMEDKLSEVPGIKRFGTSKNRGSIYSFTLDGIHPHDVGTILDREGVAVRTGHHCAQPLMDFYGIPATARASLSMYNSKEDVDALFNGLLKVRKVFK